MPFLERAVAWFARQGVTVERVMTDNGSAYRSHHWRQACGALALRHLRTRPYTPRTNGKAERFIQTSLREWAYARPFATSHERTAALAPWLDHYNTARPHTALAHQPPASPPAANRRSSVRPTAPFLRPDLPSPTTGPPGRRQERRRRPAPAGAQRPCADPPDRSRSNRREPNARSPEQRSWKRQLAVRLVTVVDKKLGLGCHCYLPIGFQLHQVSAERRYACSRSDAGDGCHTLKQPCPSLLDLGQGQFTAN